MRRRTSEWLNEIKTFDTPFSSALALASPCRTTVGAPVSGSFRISMSFMAAAAPFDLTPSALKTASLPAQRAANDDAGDGCFWQYDTSFSVKLRSTNVGLCEGTAEMSSDAAISDREKTS